MKKIILCSNNATFLREITGQKPIPTFARRSIANFNIRQGQPVRFSVTLRKKRLTSFLERFCKVLLPAQQRFRGFKKRQNQTLGLSFNECQYFLDTTQNRELNLRITLVGFDFSNTTDTGGTYDGQEKTEENWNTFIKNQSFSIPTNSADSN
jgi:ribosomal protein L5